MKETITFTPPVEVSRVLETMNSFLPEDGSGVLLRFSWNPGEEFYNERRADKFYYLRNRETEEVAATDMRCPATVKESERLYLCADDSGRKARTYIYCEGDLVEMVVDKENRMVALTTKSAYETVSTRYIKIV